MQRSAAETRIGREQPERAPATWRTKTFRALRYRNFRLFWYGQLISLIGTWMQSVAQQWLVYRITDSASKLGIVAAAGSIPVLLFSLWAGVLVDRLPKRTVIMMTQLSAMLLAFVLAALVYLNLVQFWHVVVLATILGCVNTIDMPARQAFVPEMVGAERDDLANAIALNSSIFNGARVIGPAVAGLLVAAVGEAMAFTINGVSYMAVIAGLLMMRVPRAESHAAHRAPIAELMEGLRYALRDPLKRVLFGALAIQTIFGTLHITLMPVFARDVFTVSSGYLADGEVRLGLLLGVYGLGALTAALSIASLGDRTKAGTRIMLGLFLYPVAFILFSFAPSLWIAAPLLFIGGWAMITLLATANTLMQTTTPDALRGRVMSLYTLVLVGFMPIASLLAGFLTDYFNSASYAVALTQSIVLATAFAVHLFAPHLRHIE